MTEISFLKQHSLLWIQVFFTISVIAAPEDDDNYVKMYGTDRMTSGVWELIGRYPYGDDALEKIAQDAHKVADLGTDKVMIAVKESRWLDFYDADKYPFIRVDVLVYGVQNPVVTNDTQIPLFYYITKGLRSDCVYYMKKRNALAINLSLDRHVCGVPLPS